MHSARQDRQGGHLGPPPTHLQVIGGRLTVMVAR